MLLAMSTHSPVFPPSPLPSSLNRILLLPPSTGEGIHTAIVAGKIAGKTVGEMFQKWNFSLSACRAYRTPLLPLSSLSPLSNTELRCHDSFGYEFFSSDLAARIIYRAPILLDAVAVVGARRGQAFLDFFGEVMTGVRPKSDFLQPLLLLDITLELIRQIFLQFVWGKKPLMNTEVGVEIVNKQAAKKTK
jgi:menaquinone-9 beta-reductase